MMDSKIHGLLEAQKKLQSQLDGAQLELKQVQKELDAELEQCLLKFEAITPAQIKIFKNHGKVSMTAVVRNALALYVHVTLNGEPYFEESFPGADEPHYEPYSGEL